ncbi:MAG: GntR family transcriptional regulator [Thiolinea sp.]
MLIEDYLLNHPRIAEKGKPLYQRLALALREGIHDGSLDEVDALPSERELAAVLSVSRVTIRKAIQALVGEGLIVQRRGAGNYIARRIQQPLSHLTSFSDDMNRRALSSGVVWLERTIAEPGAEERELLKLTGGEKIARLYRLRTADEQPMALELAILPVRLVPEPEQLNGSLYEYLGEGGNRPVRATQRLRAVSCDTEQATFLRIPPASPVLYIERLSYHENGSPVEFTRSHYRGDSYDFISEMAIKPGQT